jgi:cytochrome c oxidase subunit 3
MLKIKICEGSFFMRHFLTLHPYHIVNQSPWPFLSGISVFSMTIGAVAYMHFYIKGKALFFISLYFLIYILSNWWEDVVREGTYEGQHTLSVQTSLRLGMLLFIVSEIMLFFAFFWGFFHSALAPAPEIGSVWPPLGIQTLSPWGIPLLNTVILLTSGATITVAHHALVAGKYVWALEYLLSTIGLGLIFTFLQYEEYKHSEFTMSDGIYGSTFFALTGLHGAHVLIGTIFICVTTIRVFLKHFSRQHHFGFEASAWYWHFVDIVWILLYITVYWWGGQ